MYITDLNTDRFDEYFANARTFRKNARVKARPAVEGEVVETRLADGTLETTNTARADQMLITNPGGEEYLIGVEKFNARYKETEEEGVYEAKGRIKAVRFFGEATIIAPWGEEQMGVDGWFAVSLGDDNTFGTDRYIIGKDEFNATYVAE